MDHAAGLRTGGTNAGVDTQQTERVALDDLPELLARDVGQAQAGGLAIDAHGHGGGGMEVLRRRPDGYSLHTKLLGRTAKLSNRLPGPGWVDSGEPDHPVGIVLHVTGNEVVGDLRAEIV